MLCLRSSSHLKLPAQPHLRATHAYSGPSIKKIATVQCQIPPVESASIIRSTGDLPLIPTIKPNRCRKTPNVIHHRACLSGCKETVTLNMALHPIFGVSEINSTRPSLPPNSLYSLLLLCGSSVTCAVVYPCIPGALNAPFELIRW